MESVSQTKHCSLIYKPFAKTARKIEALGSGRGYEAEYTQLSAADFPAGAADDAALTARAAA